MKIFCVTFVFFLFGCHVYSQEVQENSFSFNSNIRDIIIDSVLIKLKRAYVFPEIVQVISKKISEKKVSDSYDSYNDQKMFADALTSDLQNLSNDKHLAIFYAPETFTNLVSSNSGNKSQHEIEKERTEKINRNYGFKELEILEGNVGYLNLTRFEELDHETGKRAVASMSYLSAASEIIIDLRNNPGGSGRVGQLLATYFFPEQEDKYLISNINPSLGIDRQEWTLTYVPGNRMPETPLYILIGPNTGSAAEGFAYNLQALGRAIIIGEPSYGAANSGYMVALDKGFTMFLPTGHTLNPITKSNWEGKGVQPDIPVKVQHALQTTLKQIMLKRISKLEKESEMAEDVKWSLDYLNSVMAEVILPKSEILSYVGKYEGGRRVQVIEDKLYYSTQNGPLIELKAVSSNSFVLVGADRYGEGNYRISFLKNEKGEITGMKAVIRHAPGKFAVFPYNKEVL